MWRYLLNWKDKIHLEDELMRDILDIRRNVRCQERQDVPCVKCLLIARKLGIPYKLKHGVEDPYETWGE